MVEAFVLVAVIIVVGEVLVVVDLTKAYRCQKKDSIIEQPRNWSILNDSIFSCSFQKLYHINSVISSLLFRPRNLLRNQGTH